MWKTQPKNPNSCVPTTNQIENVWKVFFNGSHGHIEMYLDTIQISRREGWSSHSASLVLCLSFETSLHSMKPPSTCGLWIYMQGHKCKTPTCLLLCKAKLLLLVKSALITCMYAHKSNAIEPARHLHKCIYGINLELLIVTLKHSFSIAETVLELSHKKL